MFWEFSAAEGDKINALAGDRGAPGLAFAVSATTLATTPVILPL
jgi:hypothetical protein